MKNVLEAAEQARAKAREIRKSRIKTAHDVVALKDEIAREWDEFAAALMRAFDPKPLEVSTFDEGYRVVGKKRFMAIRQRSRKLAA